jgi:ubiquinone/menaquinone biosynthesis C-methylase UbiE
MNEDNYEYRGMLASTWDLLRGDTSAWPDRAFYRNIIGWSGQPVLDVGCGTGRLLLDYLAGGIEIEGIDNSPEMLALCREKSQRLGLNPVLYEQHVEAMALPRRYRTIIVPSSSFQLLVDRDAADEAMRRMHDHLEPGGTLVMPFMVLDEHEDEPIPPTADGLVRTDWTISAEAIRTEDGLLVRRWSRSTFDTAQKLEHTEDRYELLRDGEVIAEEHHSRSPATRWYSQAEAVDLYRTAGFDEVRVTRWFSEEPATGDEGLFCVLGTRRTC